MKNLIIIILLSSASILKGQESKLSFGINFFPNYSLGVPVTNSSAPFIETSISLNSYQKLSFATSAYIEFRLAEKIHVSAGLGYFNNGVIQKWDYSQSIAQPGPSFWEYQSYRRVYNHHSIELPILITKHFGNRFYGVAGISPIYTFSNTIESTNVLSDGSKEVIDRMQDSSAPYRTINLYANLGFGVDYIKKDKFALYIQPYAQYGFLGIAKNVPMNYLMFSFGLSTGIRFNK